MPSGPPFPRQNLSEAKAQAAYISDAFASGDARLVVLALKEVGTARRVPVALDENPPLGEVLRTLRDLRLEVAITLDG